jgi:uncharacterized membrane protein
MGRDFSRVGGKIVEKEKTFLQATFLVDFLFVYGSFISLISISLTVHLIL